jgi:hypothetical protein
VERRDKHGDSFIVHGVADILKAPVQLTIVGILGPFSERASTDGDALGSSSTLKIS